MNLTGTARGRNRLELITDAHRQAKLFYGNEPFTLNIGTPRANVEYIDYSDGRSVPATTTYEMDYTAEPDTTSKKD